MKLLYCLQCHDIIALQSRMRRCGCGKSKGRYQADGLHAEVIGPDAVALGMRNEDILSIPLRIAGVAANLQPESGWWVIPDSSDRVKRR